MERNRFIDVLKGILIILVITLHFPIERAEQLQYMFPFWATLTVPCFMMISGYVSALSYQKRAIGRPEEAYGTVRIAEQILRFVIPYTIAFIAEWIVFRIFGLYTVNVRTYGIFALFLDYLRGGQGQGSYYFPVMIQFVFLFPIVYFVIRKYDLKGLAGCFVANGIFEILKTAYGMSDGEYRLLVFRYLFIIAAGCYMAIGKVRKNHKTVALSVISIAVGGAFAYLFSYTDYNPKILTYWRTTSFAACLLVVPVLGRLIRKGTWKFAPLEILGKASFNIFLVQMIYYNFADHIYERIPYRPAQLAFNIFNCVAAGVLFYYIEKPLTKWVTGKLKQAATIRGKQKPAN